MTSDRIGFGTDMSTEYICVDVVSPPGDCLVIIFVTCISKLAATYRSNGLGLSCSVAYVLVNASEAGLPEASEGREGQRQLEGRTYFQVVFR